MESLSLDSRCDFSSLQRPMENDTGCAVGCCALPGAVGPAPQPMGLCLLPGLSILVPQCFCAHLRAAFGVLKDSGLRWGPRRTLGFALALPAASSLPPPAHRAEGSGSTAGCWELSKSSRLRHEERKALRGESGVTPALPGR